MKQLTLLFFILFCAKISIAQVVSPDSAKYYIGKEVTVTGKIVDTYTSKGEKKVILLNFGDKHPNEIFTVVINNDDIEKFKYNPADFLKEKTIAVKGTVIMYKDKPEIILKSPDQLTIK